MKYRIIRWLAVLLGVAVACGAGLWLYMETAFGIGLSASLRCLSGLVSVLLAVAIAPAHRSKVRVAATLLSAVAWLWFCDWDLSESFALVLVASAIAGGLAAWLVLPRFAWGRGAHHSRSPD